MREVPAEHEWKVAGKVEVKAEGAGEEKEDGVGMLQVLRRSHWLGKGFIELCIGELPWYHQCCPSATLNF